MPSVALINGAQNLGDTARQKAETSAESLQIHTLIDNSLASLSLGFLKFKVIVIKEPIFAPLKEASTILTNSMPPQRNSYHCAQSSKYMIFIVMVFVTATPKEFTIETSLYEGRRIIY